jgi:hypothetical protein
MWVLFANQCVLLFPPPALTISRAQLQFECSGIAQSRPDKHSDIAGVKPGTSPAWCWEMRRSRVVGYANVQRRARLVAHHVNPVAVIRRTK